jgi:hypothetical protein
MAPFSKPEEQNTLRADSTIVSIRCSFEGRRIFVTVAVLKAVSALVFESMDGHQYATEMNPTQLYINRRQIQVELLYLFEYCFQSKYSESI